MNDLVKQIDAHFFRFAKLGGSGDVAEYVDPPASERRVEADRHLDENLVVGRAQLVDSLVERRPAEGPLGPGDDRLFGGPARRPGLY